RRPNSRKRLPAYDKAPAASAAGAVVTPTASPRVGKVLVGSLPAAAAVAIAFIAINARPLPCPGYRPRQPFEFPAVYPPLPVSVLRGRRVERIGNRGCPLCLLRHRRGNLPRTRPDYRHGD